MPSGPGIVVALAGAFILLGLSSGLLGRTPLTAPIIALGAGLVLGPLLGAVPTDLDGSGVQLLAELTLAILLFVDASRVDLTMSRTNGPIPARMLLIGLPLVVGLGTVVGALTLDVGWASAFILACVLAPTDAALSQPMLREERIPLRVRQAVNVESGLNDGLVAPFLAVALVVAGAGDGDVGRGFGSVAVHSARLVGGGLLVGVAVGGAVSLLLRVLDWRTLQPALRQIAIAAVPLLTFGAATLVGGNGFVAAFVAGAVFGAMIADGAELLEFGEDVGQLGALLVFIAFGAAFVGPATTALDVRTVGYVLACLTVVRIVPIAFSLVGTGLRSDTVGLLAWFGPRGLATIVFGLEVLELGREGDLPGDDRLFGIASIGVIASVALHGLSARPLASWYAGRLEQRAHEPDLAEHVSVDAMRMRGAHHR